MYTIKTAKMAIKDGIKAYLAKDEQGDYRLNEVNCLPFYMEGAPGIGKTEIVKQISEELGVGYVSFSLVHHTRNTLLGLPVIKEMENGDRYTSYTMSEIIAKVLKEREAGHEEGILLLDEFPCMSDSILPAMLAFLQTKNIGTHTLPRGWVLVLCGNPAQYNRSTHTFDAAITDRIRKIEIEYSAADFTEYGKNIGLSDIIIRYIELHPENAYRFSKQKGNEELVTCRSWENLSHAIECYEVLGQSIDLPMVQQFIKSEAVASNFVEYYRQCNSGITEKDVRNILSGKATQTTIDKCKALDYVDRWNATAYILNFVQNGASKNETQEQILKCAKQIQSKIEEKRENEDFDEAFYGILATTMSANRILSIWKSQSIEISDFEENIVEIVVEDWKKSVAGISAESKGICGFHEISDEDIEQRVQKWTDTMEKKLNSSRKELSNQLTHFFEFLAQIDEEEKSLAERLYLEISSSAELLRAVCACSCEPYVEMCKKQFGMQQVG